MFANFYQVRNLIEVIDYIYICLLKSERKLFIRIKRTYTYYLSSLNSLMFLNEAQTIAKHKYFKIFVPALSEGT